MKKLSVTHYSPVFARMPQEFDGYRVAHIADLHNADFKGRIECQIKKQKPDIIVMTGDIVSFENRYDNAMSMVGNLARIAPIFYVNGNHEARLKNYAAWRGLLTSAGVICLENEIYMLKSDVALIGINDPKFFEHRTAFKEKVSQLCGTLPEKTFKILLTHRPSQFQLFADLRIDLTFAGHAHGGQIRLPKIGALYYPGLGLFPKNISGLCRIGDSYMVASRGLWHTFHMPPRIFNPPELVFVTLSTGTVPPNREG